MSLSFIIDPEVLSPGLRLHTTAPSPPIHPASHDLTSVAAAMTERSESPSSGGRETPQGDVDLDLGT